MVILKSSYLTLPHEEILKKNARDNFETNHRHIFRVFDTLPNVLFTANETKRDYK